MLSCFQRTEVEILAAPFMQQPCTAGTDIDHFLFCVVDVCINSKGEATIYVSLLRVGHRVKHFKYLIFHFIDSLVGYVLPLHFTCEETKANLAEVRQRCHLQSLCSYNYLNYLP